MIISLRRTSASTRALLVAAVLLVLILRWWTSPKVSFDEEQLESLWTMPRDDVARLYESKRQSLLEDQGYNPQAAAQSVRCPPWTADGYPSLDSRPDVYANRLGTFVLNRLGLAPMRSRLDHAIGRVYKQVPPTISAFPQHLYSTDRFGDAGVPDAFRLWKALLPLPLDGSLENLVPQTEWAMPARKGSPWSVLVADSSDIETHLSAWVGDSISKGAGGWAQFWQALSGRHRAQVFKYMAMLFEGGMYASTRTLPLAHPYLWGLGSKSVLHPELKVIKRVLRKHAASSDSTYRRLWDRSVPIETNWTVPSNVWEEAGHDDVQWAPPHPSDARLGRRSPFFGQASQPDEASSILSPEINLVVAIDFDSSLASQPAWRALWRLFRSRQSHLQTTSGRSLQFSNSILTAKQYHPVLLDTIATVWEHVGADGLNTLDPVDVTGAGPFTDAVLRYLLVRYGVTVSDLRGLSGPVRVGDVLILQEGAFLGPDDTYDKMLQYLRQFFPMLPGSGVAQMIPGKSLWYWGTGFQAWWSGGRRVATRLRRTQAGEAADWN